MDPKELKNLLKQARAALKETDYNEALKLCKTILKAEPNNYTALVIAGAAYSNLSKGQQCLEAYRHAIKTNPSLLPAWQGLVQHYEKTRETHPDLIEGYKRIAAFHENDDEAKYVENTLKFAGVLVSQGDFRQGLKVLMRLAKKMTLPINVATLVVQIVSNLKGLELKPEEESVYINSLRTLIKNPDTAKEDYFKSLYALLYKRNDMKTLIDECIAAEPVYNSIYHPLEYLCRLYVEGCPEVTYAQEVGTMTYRLFKLYPSSIYGYFAKGKYCFENGRHRECIQWLKEGLDAKFNALMAETLIQCKLKFGDFSGTLESISDYKSKDPDPDPTKAAKLRQWEIEALLGSDMDHAQKLLDEWKSEAKEEDTSTIKRLQAKLFVWRLDFKSLREITAHLEEEEHLLHLYQILSEENDSMSEEVIKFLDSQEANPEVIVLGGLTLWKLQKFTEAVTVLSKLTGPGRFHPLPTIYLARLHRMAGDTETAIKYLEGAYEMYPCIDTGCMLSDLYFEAGHEEKNRNLLTAASKRLKKINSKWTWLRLGLLHLQSGNANEATVVLQSAVRADYNDAHLWETLADAYLARGSFHSALKSYNKALELHADPIYPTYKIGVLYQQLNDHSQAIKAFEELLVKMPDYVPAILELAKTHYKVAQHYFSVKRDASGIQAVEECIRWSMRSLEVDNKVLAWKMIGDCSLLLSDIPLDRAIRVPAFFSGENSEVENKVETAEEVMRLGTNCFHMALKTVKAVGMSGAQSELYHDLALSYRLRALRCSDEAKQKELLEKAMSAVKIAVSKSKNSYTYWNTLGVITSHPTLGLGPLAQHAFIKSLHLEPNNPVAWTNLGFLHYHANSYKNAHHCFCRAQMMDPSYSYCWLGESLVADALVPEQAIDQYRHTCLLENYPDLATLAYSDWVCRLLATGKETEENYIYSIVKCEAVGTSFDLISLYCNRHPDDPYGFMYRGLFGGRLGLLNTAEDSFFRCLALLKSGRSSMVDTVKCNLAATLLNLDKVEDAFAILQGIEDPDFTVCCVAAEAFDKAGDSAMCIQAYEQAVEKAPTDSAKAEALIGLGIVFGKCKGLEEAKTHIFQGWRLARDKIAGLLAIVALSLQKEELTDADRVIAKAVYDEIQPLSDYAMKNDVVTISLAWHIAQGDIIGARNCILRTARVYPWNPELWKTLAHFLIECHEKDETVRHLIRKAVGRANVFERTSEQLIALSYLMEDNLEQGLVYAKKVVHSEPYSPTAWTVLILALYRNMRDSPCDAMMKYTIACAQRALTLCTDQASSIATWLKDYIEIALKLLSLK